ncbi:GntR family transcriptional regulator [Streptomyces sp. NPDC018019]|uniref:GntR family transcriptional regulator n=1 Tax=Streptomyces sp. NPDC018019 TaxID=3365030 RepID=UPI00378C1FAF
MTDTPNKVPPYKRVADQLRQEVKRGDLAPGDKLETEAELAQRFSVSRGTVRRAIDLLKSEGLLISRQGSGAFVRERPHVNLRSTGANYRDRRATGRANYNAEVAAQGRRTKQRIVEAGPVPAPIEVATRLGMAEGASVISRVIVATVDGDPTQLMETYYPVDIAEGTRIAEPRPIKGGAHSLIEDSEGPIARRIVQFVEDLEARMPTPEEARELDISPGVPLVRTLRTAYDATGRAIEVLVVRVAADRHMFRYVIDVP